MATTYTSTIDVNVWKEHTCSGCGNVYRYLFKRKKSGQGSNPDAARAAAHAAVVKALSFEVDMQPCPSCGLYQPDMVGAKRARRHGWLTFLAVLLPATTLILYATDVLNAPVTALVTAGLCALVVLAHLLIDTLNPNRDLEANHQLAQMRVEKGDLWKPSDRPGTVERDEDAAGSGWTTSHTVAYALLVLGLLAFLTPELLRVLHGWKLNSDWVPVVAGPGDRVYIYLPHKITSVKGYWRGTPAIEVLNAQEVGLNSATLSGESKADNWGQTITIGSKESKTNTHTLWTYVTLPANARLENQALKLRIGMVVNYPELQGVNQWRPTNFVMPPYETTLRLSSANAGSRYRNSWWGSFLSGAALILVPSILLMRLSSAMRQRAHPTSIFVPGEDQAEEEQQPAEVQPIDGAIQDKPAPTLEEDDRIHEGRPRAEPPPLP
jgi:hypothetical protein